MIDSSKLWTKLPPKADNIEGIRQDLKAGLVPNLPYFIIDNKEAKEKISKDILNIDTQFSLAYIIANYGNGKTNLLRYLEYFFNAVNSDRNIIVAYWRADVDKYDLILFLLYIIQIRFKKQLISAIQNLSIDDLDDAAIKYEDAFGAIEEYVSCIKSNKGDADKLADLVDLGTGRKYTKGAFGKYHLPQLTDYNRREVLVFFLNIIAKSGKYIIFAIDELEKIHEKSKARFNSFLTSYRELIDLKSYINGHCLITAATDASDENALASLNPAFQRRIKTFVSRLTAIEGKEGISELVHYLNDLLKTGKSAEEVDKIINILAKSTSSNNNLIVKNACENLMDSQVKTWEDLLDEYSLRDIYKEEYEKLKLNGAFEGIYTKFFDSLSRYVKVTSDLELEEVKASERVLVRNEQQEVLVFLFSDDFESNKNRLDNISSTYPACSIRIFRPLSADASFDIEPEKKVKEIVTYNPEELMTLFDMFYDNYTEYGEKVQNVIHTYSNNVF